MTKVTTCLEKEKPNIEDIKMLEYSKSVKNLPNSRELKCYLSCLYTGFGVLKNGKIDANKAREIFSHFKPEEQLRFFNMVKGCHADDKDICELVYKFNVCAKKNAPKDFFTFWRPDIEVEA